MYYVIVNPESGEGKGGKLWIKTAKFFYRLGITYEAYLTNQSMDAKYYAQTLTEGKREPRIIIVIGGDGTLNEVLNGLDINCPVTLCVIPAGTCNNLAKSLHISTNPIVCLKQLIRYTIQGAFPADGKKALRPNTRLIDYGVISYGPQNEHRRFLVCSGIGLDAAICKKINQAEEKKGRISLPKQTAILTAGLKELAENRGVSGYLVLDGKERVDFRNIRMISAHICSFDMGMKMAQDANPEDGQLTLKVFHQSTPLENVPIVMNAIVGKKKISKSMRTFTCKEVTVHLDEERSIHVDSEDCESLQDVNIRCIPGKLRMIM